MTTGIESITALARSVETQLQDISHIQQGQPALDASFANLIEAGISHVNESVKASDAILQDMALNKNVSAHEVMLTMEKAKMELKLMVEVRNKLLESYQEVLRMQV